MAHLKRPLLLAALVVLLAAPGRPWLRADEAADNDRQFLEECKVATDGPGLLRFLRSGTLTDAGRRELARLIGQLGDPAFKTREKASRKISGNGRPALPLLRGAVKNTDPEVARRARFCIEEIERGPGPALPAAAVRLLVLRRPARSVETLLDYLPSADDEGVEEEILTALGILGVRDRKVDPLLEQGLKVSSPQRRAASAYVTGRFGAAAQRAIVRGLLADADSTVRLRAAQGLVAARDKAAVPVLVELLGDVHVPTAVSWQAEELLYRIAGDQGPGVSMGDGSAPVRKKCQAAWSRWWRDQAAKVDLAGVADGQRLLGLTLVAELDSNKVWECGRDGKPRWTLEGLGGPIDAYALPGGRVLVAENQQSRVTERDLKGKIVWEKALSQSPIACQRLPNGNTFIATYNSVMEVTRDGKDVYSHSPGGNFFIYGAQRLRNGHIVCASGQGEVLEMDRAGKVLKRIPVATNGGWCSVEGLPGGRLLVAVTGQNKVLEVDGSGKTVWECSVNGACHATRLPNGNTLVASMTGNRVAEVNRAGKSVWEQTTAGRPFHVHRR